MQNKQTSIEPIELILKCPECGSRHIDEGEFENKIHHTHACQHCGFVWRPAVEPTKGVQFLKGLQMSNKQMSERAKLCDIINPNTLDLYRLLHKLQHGALSPNDLFVTLQKLEAEIDRQNTIALRWQEEAVHYYSELRKVNK